MASGKPNKNGKSKGKSTPPKTAASKDLRGAKSAKQKTSLTSLIKGALLGKSAGKKAAQPAKPSGTNGKGPAAKASKAVPAKSVSKQTSKEAPKDVAKVEAAKPGKKGPGAAPAKAVEAAVQVAKLAKGAKALPAAGKAGKGKAVAGLAGLARGGVDESVCREVACEGLSTSAGYCRLHYIKNWKKIKRKELILKEKKLNQYIEELVVKYPDKYIEAIRQDLANDKDFAKVIHDLDLDESVDEFDVDSESVDGLIDNIKRDFDDEGDAF